MKLIEVTDKQTVQEFLEMPLTVYKDDPNYIRPLNQDIEAVFDPKKNKYFENGEAIRWVLKDDNGNLIGRVAAFVHWETSHTHEQPTGGMGFFDCIDDKEAAFTLFDACKQWLKERNLEAVDGPINFGEKDRWWGLLVDGFDPPTYTMNYNPPYYRQLFKTYGFKVYFEQYVYLLDLHKSVPQVFVKISERIFNNPEYEVKHAKRRELNKYAEDFREIYNEAWQTRKNFKEMTVAQSQHIMNSMKPILVEELLWFVYHKGKPIGFFLMIPEINQIVRHLNGKLDLWGKLKFLWYKWRKECTNIYGVVFGVVPQFQNRGIEASMVLAAGRKVQPMKRYDNLIMTWIGDFNPKMVSMVEKLEASRIKTYFTYRKLFDESREFTRHPMVE